MNTINQQKINAIQHEKRKLGAYFGMLAGTGFALTAWGIDAIRMAQAHAHLPWAKFIIGWLACLLICGLAGWLSSRMDNSLVAVLAWFGAGCILTIGVAWLAFQGIARVFDGFYPAIASQLDYTLNSAIYFRTGIGVAFCGLLSIAVGISQLNNVDSAVAGTHPLQQLSSLILGMLIFGVAGLIVDALLQSNLRNPVIQVDRALQYALQHRGQTVEIRDARENGQTAIRTLGDLKYQPYHLTVQSYDEYLSMVSIVIDFGAVQTYCSVLENNLAYCDPPPGVNSASVGAETPISAASTASSTSVTGQIASSSAITSTADNPAQTLFSPPLLPDQAGDLPALNLYRLNVSIEPEQRSFQGELKLNYTNTETASLDTLFFRLLPNGHRSYGNGAMSVLKVEVDNAEQPIQLSQEDTVLAVEMGRKLEPGNSAQISVSFQGTVPNNFGGGENSSGYGIYNYTDEVMALASWYPILAVYDEAGWHLDPVSYIGDSVYSDIAFYSVEIELPIDHALVSTGVTQQIISEGDRQKFKVESGPVRDFFMILSPHFTRLSSETNGTLVTSYHLPGHGKGAQRALEIASQSLEIFNNQFGRYPYTEMDIVEAPMQYASGVEYPGIMLIGDFLYVEFDQTSFDVTVAHEVAHQWWYNLVGNDVFKDPWLDEALASYTSGLYLESTQGHFGLMGLMDYYRQRYQRVRDSSGDHPVSESLAYFENSAYSNAYGGIIYAKGALFLDAVRQEIGDQAFLSALQSYFLANRFHIARSRDLLEAFEAAAGRTLDELYQTWGVSP